jgi:hypothetical protein
MQDDEGKSTRQKAEESLRNTLRAMEKYGGDESRRNGVVAKNVMFEDIGHFGEPSIKYHLDETRRDILLAHSRQDSAHALINTTSLLEQVAWLSGQIRILQIMVLLLLCGVGYVIWKLQ